MGRNKKVTKEQIEKLMEDGYNKYEIADILDISQQTILRRLREGKESKPKIADEQILELVLEGKSNQEIAEILELHPRTIANRISKIRNEKSEKIEESEQVQEDMLQKQSEILKKARNKTLTNQDIKTYRQELDNKEHPHKIEIDFMIKMYIRTGKAYMANQFLDGLIKRIPVINIEERQKLQEMKQKVTDMLKEQAIRNLVKGKVKTETIAKQVGIPETEVIQIKHKIEQAQGIEM